MVKLENLSKAKLIEVIKMYAKNWLAHDGCWFLTFPKRLIPGLTLNVSLSPTLRIKVRKASGVFGNSH